MVFTIPKKMPLLSDFTKECMVTMFPDPAALGCGKTGYGYSSACDKAARAAGLRDDHSECVLEVDSDLFRLLYELNEQYKRIFGRTYSGLEKGTYRTDFPRSLDSFCDAYSGSIKGWLKADDPKKGTNKSFLAAGFFAYLMVTQEDSRRQLPEFLMKCLAILGVTEVEESMKVQLCDFTWKDAVVTTNFQNRAFYRLESKPIVILATALLTIYSLIGSYNEEMDRTKIEAFHSLLQHSFADTLRAADSAEMAEKALLRNINYFEPRSILLGGDRMYLQDLFVNPVFKHREGVAASPMGEIVRAQKSKRILMMAKTGLGKTAYLQMSTLCILQKKYAVDSPDKRALEALAASLDVPEDMYVISVPARMFSYCYNHNEASYRAWTTDFVTLFFNVMWRFSSSFNFFSNQNSPGVFDRTNAQKNDSYKVDDALRSYLQDLAKRGKLLLVLDSFDEIPSGEMRSAYLKSLASFYDRYCNYPEGTQVGAHVIVSSREMSPETMAQLRNALRLQQDSDEYGIETLSREQRRKLIYNWNQFVGSDDQDPEDLLEQIESNHFYLEYSVNPYMLSVVCAHFGFDMNSITHKFIEYAVGRMINNYPSVDVVIYDVLCNVERIFQEIAGETIASGNPHFSRKKFERYLSRHIDKTEMTPEDVRNVISKIHEIFVTEVGLIVPADGDDSDYQFINGQIRYELAAEGIQRNLERDERAGFYHDSLLPAIRDVNDYVGLLVPLLCHIKTEDVPLAEMLVSDLVMHEFQNAQEDETLIRAMMDLLLDRYGISIITTSDPGLDEAKFVHRAQRKLLLRLLASPSFQPTQKEKQEILHQPILRVHQKWLSKALLESLQD